MSRDVPDKPEIERDKGVQPQPSPPEKGPDPGPTRVPLFQRLADILADDRKSPRAEEIPAEPLADRAISPEPIPPELAGHPRYQVLKQLGAGGMGTVYQARHRLMERLVALKVVKPHLVDKPGAVDRFRREARAAAQLSHPNIVTAYDAETVGNAHFLVMEFVEGENLADLGARQGPLPAAQACDYVRQAALGLEHAHQRGTVHRDIKPQNLILTPQGQIKILDFGLARFLSESGPENGDTQAGVVMGSPDYMAPEQARDAHHADIRADIYALGCTLYQLLAGRVPFPGGSAVDKVSAHLHRQPAPLSRLRRDLPAELVQVVQRMMAKEPAQRYPTPAVAAEALTPFCQAPPAPAVVPQRQRRTAVRLIAGAALLALGVIGLLLGAPVIVKDFRQEKAPAPVTKQEPTKEARAALGSHTSRTPRSKEFDEFPITASVAGKETKQEKQVAAASSTEPQPLKQYLKSRGKILYVAQDGRNNTFRTIGEAVQVLQRGEAVVVLDQGPYRERIDLTLPEDVGVVSEIGTRVEIPDWGKLTAPGPTGMTFCTGWHLRSRHLRISGFDFVCPRREGRTVALFLPGRGDLVLERCRVRHSAHHGFTRPKDNDAAFSDFGALSVLTDDQASRICIQDSYLEGGVVFPKTGGDILIQRNCILQGRLTALGLSVVSGAREVVIRHNLIVSLGIGISFDAWSRTELRTTPVSIINNLVDVRYQGIAFSPYYLDKDKDWYPRQVRIQNNCFRSEKGTVIALTARGLLAAKGSWQVGHNCYQDEPRHFDELREYPRDLKTDLLLPAPLLSMDPKEPGFLRIAADSPLATAGAGGDLPKYIGPLAPGPAPKEGDWFTRLQAYDQEASTAKPTPTNK